MGEVLYKILEELENESQLAHEEMRRCARGNPLQFDEVKGYARAMEYVVDTIRSHMEKRKKVSRARIITREIDEKLYYEIEYKEAGKDEYDVGYGSYDLNNVISWFNECFEFCGKTKVASDNDGWIPVEERLPREIGQYVLGTTVYGEMVILKYDWNIPHSKKMFFHLSGTAANVIAWKPLPEPYRAADKPDWKENMLNAFLAGH